jgi:hypothetical protein
MPLHLQPRPLAGALADDHRLELTRDHAVVRFSTSLDSLRYVALREGGVRVAGLVTAGVSNARRAGYGRVVRQAHPARGDDRQCGHRCPHRLPVRLGVRPRRGCAGGV